MRISDWSSDVCSSDLLTLRLPNGSEYPHNGRVEYAESEVDPQTGTVAIRLVFPNPDDLLLPNQFVTLLAREGEVPSLPVVPQTAVLTDSQGRFVYLLNADSKGSPRRTQPGRRVVTGWADHAGLRGADEDHR